MELINQIIYNRIINNQNNFNIINVIFSFCYILNNEGGGIYINLINSYLKISKSNFLSCYSYSYGGSIRFIGGEFHLNQTCFNNCSNSINYGSCLFTEHNNYYISDQNSAFNCPSFQKSSPHCCFLTKFGIQNTFNLNFSKNYILWNSGIHHWEYIISNLKYYLSINHLCGSSLGISNPLQKTQNQEYGLLINSTNTDGYIWCLGSHVYIFNFIFLQSNSKIGYLSSAQLTINNCYLDYNINTLNIILNNCYFWYETQTKYNFNLFNCNSQKNSKEKFKIIKNNLIIINLIIFI